MFVYKSPRTGNNAIIESITPGKRGVSEVEVHWAGGGIWPADRGQLMGHVKDYDQLPYVGNDEFKGALTAILSGDEPERESVADLTETE